MVNPSKISKYLNNLLNVKNIPDVSRNGLQVKVKEDVKKIAFAVDATFNVCNKAKKLGCEMLIVHHGVKWAYNKKNPDKTSLNKRHECYFRKNNISLYGVHLPLDLHSKYGNNAQLANILELKSKRKFGRYHKIDIGYMGSIKPSNLNDISKKISKALGYSNKAYLFGKKVVKSVAIVSGGAGDMIQEAILKKADCYIVGEISHSQYIYAKDNFINLIDLGHYASETVGVKALMPLLEKEFNVKTIFIDEPTGY